jgi:hypothetical protein
MPPSLTSTLNLARTPPKQTRNLFSGIDEYVHLYRPHFGWAHDTLGEMLGTGRKQ